MWCPENIIFNGGWIVQEFNRNKGLTDFLSANFDWIEFSIFKESLNNIITNILLLKEDDFEPLPRGRFGYNTQLKWSNGLVFILYNADLEGNAIKNDRNGIHIIMTGRGCRAFEYKGNFRELFYLVLVGAKDNKFTRIDLAIDDKKDEIINFERFWEELEAGNVSSKWKTWDLILSRSLGDNHFKGRTLYLGKQSSDIFCRVYDKGLERFSKNCVEIEFEKLEWTRLEIVFKRDRAKLLSRYFLESEEGVGQVALAVLNQYIRFLIPNPENERKRAWETAEWWEVLLHNVGKLKLTRNIEERSIEDFEEWVDKQIGPTLAAILKAKEGETDWLYKIINKASTRLKSKHVEAINKYQNQNS